MSISTLYADHIHQLQNRYEQLLDSQGYDGLLIHSGCGKNYYLDDNHLPFKSNPQLQLWLPLSQHPQSSLLIRPAQKPTLFYYNPTDFWYKAAGAPEGFWTEHFEIVEISHGESCKAFLNGIKNLAFIGEEEALAASWGLKNINPQPLVAALHWHRAIKSEYEIDCLRQANQIAARGHRAAQESFDQGGSEFDIQMAYLAATSQRENQLPYGNIVALNQNAAVLHYQLYELSSPQHRHSFLIDAGATCNGYAADITRTYGSAGGAKSAEAELFAELIGALDAAQLALVEEISVGQSFVDLHQRMCLRIASLLQQFGLVEATAEAQLEQGILRAFFPHGLGHLLGLQVHDMGGLQSDAQGTPAPAPENHPFLRLTRELEEGMVFTIEPGIYLIDSLLAELKGRDASKSVNWDLVDRLRPFGGIRIEDNILLSGTGCENFTRDAFARA